MGGGGFLGAGGRGGGGICDKKLPRGFLGNLLGLKTSSKKVPMGLNPNTNGWGVLAAKWWLGGFFGIC